MSRFDTPTIYNPYGWRLAELADPTTEPVRRRRLVDELVVWEAEELAHGYRHVTIVHGDPNDVGAARDLAEFYDAVGVLAARAGWTRVRGGVDFVTVTVGGGDADERIAEFAAAAHAANPGGWQITATVFGSLVAV